MSNWVTGEEIHREALRIDADRVCFASGAERRTVPISKVEIESALDEAKNAGVRPKVKFQRNLPGGTFENVSGYRDLFNSRKVLSDLRRWRADKPGSLIPADVSDAARLHPNAFSRALARHVANLREGGLRGNRPTSVLMEAAAFMASVRKHSKDSHLEYSYSLVEFLLVAYEHGLQSILNDGFTGLEPEGAAEVMSAVGEARLWSESGASAAAVEVARLNVLGQLASLGDRDMAASFFKQMKTMDTESWVTAAYYDMGAMTYFDVSEVMTPVVKARADAVKQGWQTMQSAESENTFAVAMSVDPAFFRIYAHQMLHVAQQVPHIDFVFVLCASDEDAEGLLSDSRAYLESLHHLNRSGFPRNISFLRTVVPDWVKSPQTFYASARFFAVDNLLLDYEFVYVMDIDLTFTEDPAEYFSRITNRDFAMPFAQGHSLLSPWRRFMAGNVIFSRKVHESPVLNDLENYLARGLEEVDSWMLDQNALAFTVERSASATDHDLGPRPLWQFAFRSTWENRYRRGQG